MARIRVGGHAEGGATALSAPILAALRAARDFRFDRWPAGRVKAALLVPSASHA